MTITLKCNLCRPPAPGPAGGGHTASHLQPPANRAAVCPTARSAPQPADGPRWQMGCAICLPTVPSPSLVPLSSWAERTHTLVCLPFFPSTTTHRGHGEQRCRLPGTPQPLSIKQALASFVSELPQVLWLLRYKEYKVVVFPSYSRERMTTAALCSGVSEEGTLALSLLPCMSAQPRCFCPFPPDGSGLTSHFSTQTFLPGLPAAGETLTRHVFCLRASAAHLQIALSSFRCWLSDECQIFPPVFGVLVSLMFTICSAAFG